MPLLEIPFLLANIATLLLMLLHKNAGWAAAAVLVLLLLHISFVSWRWQFAPAYGAAALLPLFLLLQYGLMAIYQKQLYNWVSHLVIVLCFLLLIASVLLTLLFPVFSLKKPAGEFQIGTVSYVWEDEAREESYTSDAADKRQVVLQIWFPSDGQVATSDARSPYFPDRKQATRQLQADFGFPGWLFQHFDAIQTHAYETLEFAAAREKYPVVFFSHGLPAARFVYSYFIEHFVSNGYIVVGLQHPYTALATSLSEEKVVTFDKRIMSLNGDFTQINPALSPIVHTQAEDAIFVLDEIANRQKSGEPSAGFWRKFDLSQLAMAGHSLGAATMLEALHKDDRFRAGIFLDGYPYGGANMDEGLRQPILYMTDHRGTVPRYMDAAVEAKKKRILQNGGWDLSIRGTHHFMFSDASLYSPLISLMFPYARGSAIKPERAHDIINQVSFAFLESRLRNQPAEAVEEALSAFPEISVNERYGAAE
jgi:pimeloyl-ACP methyl ester carboxylesterase